jgi:phosphate ABC transporter phosphate-binding protein
VLHGAGATFPAPIYQKWFESFAQRRPGLRVSFDAVGSEEGIRRIGAGEVDFGASGMPLSAEQLQEKGKLLQFATVLGAVVPIYNVKDAPDGLNLTPEVLAGIFLGKIVSWNAREIRAINRHVRLPDEKIAVLRRSDDSGTTYAWTDYLSKVNEEWKSKVGTGAMPWPVGAGAQRNQGVADTMAKTANSIGYVEFIYALHHELNFAEVRNSTGEYVKADLDSVTAAAKAAAGSRKIVCGTQERGISHSADSVRNDGLGFGSRLLKAGGAGGGGTHFGGVDAKAEMGEPGLAEGHEAGVEIAPDEEKKERHSGVIFVADGINDGESEVQAQRDFKVRHPSGFIFVFFGGEGSGLPFDPEFWRAREFGLLAEDGFQDRLSVAHA